MLANLIKSLATGEEALDINDPGKPVDELTYEEAMQELIALTNEMGGP